MAPQYKIASATLQSATGTVTINATTAVVGSTTTFTTQLAIGDVIKVAGEVRRVSTITDNTHLTVSTAFAQSLSGQTYTRANLVLLNLLTVPVPDPKGEFSPWAESKDLADGLSRGFGRPRVTWKWGFLTLTQRGQLKTFCTGKSARVYICTKTNEADAMVVYEAAMTWPDGPESRQAGHRLDFSIEFRDLVAI